MNLTLANVHSFSRRPVWARRMNQFVAAHKGGLGRVIVTHIPTGYRACHAPTQQTATKIARELVKAYGSKWNFSKVTKRAMRRVTRSREIIAKNGGFF